MITEIEEALKRLKRFSFLVDTVEDLEKRLSREEDMRRQVYNALSIRNNELHARIKEIEEQANLSRISEQPPCSMSVAMEHAQYFSSVNFTAWRDQGDFVLTNKNTDPIIRFTLKEGEHLAQFIQEVLSRSKGKNESSAS